jgi:hypothetical protein
MRIVKRHFLKQTLLALGGLTLLPGPSRPALSSPAGVSSRRQFKTRGVVLVPDDLSWTEWPDCARRAGLTTIGLHHGSSPEHVVKYIQSAAGQRFVTECHNRGLAIEYELHAMRELLPRDLFAASPDLFPMNDQGQRTPDANLCVHAPRGLELAAGNAVRLARALRPDSGRYFFWGDDGLPWCRCQKCRGLSDSDQALIFENHLLSKLREHDSRAQLAHLAYANTLSAPTQVKPGPGVFLEYAPIHRRYDVPYAEQNSSQDRDSLQALDKNLEVFPRDTAQVLEYWLDVSRFSKWTKPVVKLPFSEAVLRSDLRAYAARGLRHVTTFAVYIDADYVRRFGEPAEVQRYGELLAAL